MSNFSVPKYFEHVTLNSGHFRHSYLSEIDREVLLKLRRIAADAMASEGTVVADGITFEAVQEQADMYMGTLFSEFNGQKVPFLLTSGAKSTEAGKKLWKILHTTDWGIDLKFKTTIWREPGIPYVADLLLHTITPHAWHYISSGMSGDFCRCMGWCYLYPEIINNIVLGGHNEKGN